MEPITVRVHARDPISEAGVASELRARPEVRVVTTNDSEQVRVVVIVTDSVDDDALTILRIVQRTGVSRGASCLQGSPPARWRFSAFLPMVWIRPK